MDNLYAIDPTLQGRHFEKDFNTHHPHIHKFNIISKNINLQAPLIKPTIKSIETSTSIRDVQNRLVQLCKIITPSSNYREVMAQIIPKDDDQCDIILVPTYKQRDASFNLRVVRDKANTFAIRHQTMNFFNQFDQISIGFRNRFDTKSKSLFLKFNYPLTLLSSFNINANWKTKNIDENTISNSVTTRFFYNTFKQNGAGSQYTFRIQNRSNKTSTFKFPQDIQASNLYEASSLHLISLPNPYSASLNPSLGIVPVKSSYFAKLKTTFRWFHQFTNTLVTFSNNLGVVVGKNIITNDLIEYKPWNRAQFYIRNKIKYIIKNYPHRPLEPFVSIWPYTYICHWFSGNRKRVQKFKHELQLGAGVYCQANQNFSNLKISMEFNCIKFVDKKPIWAPKFSFGFGEL